MKISSYWDAAPSAFAGHLSRMVTVDIVARENAHGTQIDRLTVSCFPVKVRGGSAGWTRAVAILENAA
jgi:hypothetical protein